MTLRNKRVLVTGANGFLGRNLIPKLVEEKADVHALDLHPVSIPGVKSYKADITDSEKFQQIVRQIKPQVVFHLAAYPDSPVSIDTIRKTNAVNINGTVSLLEAIKDTKALLIHIGSYKEYGNKKKPFTEDMMLEPTSPYAISKAAAENYCRIYASMSSIEIVLLRFPTLYGPFQGKDMLIPHVITSCLNKQPIVTTPGRQKREFLYVGDAVSALLKAAEEPAAKGRVLNVGSGHSVSLMEVIKLIVSLVDPKAKISATLPYRKNEVWDIVGNNNLSRKVLKWKPSTSLKVGLKQTIEWYKNGRF